MTVCIISMERICILTRKLRITRKSIDNVARDLAVLERKVMTRKDIASTSNKTWARRVDSMKVSDPSQNSEQHGLRI